MSDASTLPGGSPERGGGSRSDRGPGLSAARGAALIAVAVIIGIVLLQYTDDGTTGPVGDGGNGKASGGTTTTSSPSSSTTAGSGGTTATTTAAKPPAQVTVLVLNGSGKPGAAATQTDLLKAKGYATLPAADAPARQGTVVEFKPGYDRECATVATSVGGSPKVEEISAPPPNGSETANCVVILGA
jgi:hypothetical protein